MQVEGVTVTKIIEPQQLGVHNDKIFYICHGKFGYYLRYDGKNYSIPEWTRRENLNEMFNLTHAINIIDWKIRNKVPRGEAGCKYKKLKKKFKKIFIYIGKKIKKIVKNFKN
jgi:hypothetical protein